MRRTAVRRTGLNLFKEGARLLEEALGLRIDVLVAQGGELFEFGALCGIETLWNLRPNGDEQVSLATALEIFHAPRLETKGAARLRSGGNGNACLAREGGDVDFAPEGGLHEADRHFAGEVSAVAAKDLVFLNMDHDVQVAIGRTSDTGGTIAGGTQSDSGVDTRGDADAYGGLLVDATFAAASTAWALDDLASSRTPGAGLAHHDDAGIARYLAATAAGLAGHCLRALLSATAAARLTAHWLAEAELLFGASDGLFESDL